MTTEQKKAFWYTAFSISSVILVILFFLFSAQDDITSLQKRVSALEHPKATQDIITMWDHCESNQYLDATGHCKYAIYDAQHPAPYNVKAEKPGILYGSCGPGYVWIGIGYGRYLCDHR